MNSSHPIVHFRILYAFALSTSFVSLHCSAVYGSPPTGALLYTVSNVPGVQFESRSAAIIAMKSVSAAADRLRLEDKTIDSEIGLVTEFWAPSEVEAPPNFGPFEWSAAFCVPAYSSFCIGVHGSEFSLQASINSGIEALESCAPIIWQPSSGWYWNSFAVSGLSAPYLVHAKRDWTLQIPSGEACEDSKESNVTILARRDAYCDSGFDGPAETEPGSPYWVCRNNQAATLQYYATDETGSCPQNVGNPCDVSTGAKIEQVIDYDGPALKFVRTYRSNVMMVGESLNVAVLGPNWTHNYLRSIHWAKLGSVPDRLYRPDGGFLSLQAIDANVWIAKNGSGIQVRDSDPDVFGSAWIVYLPSGAKEVYSYFTVGTQVPYPQWRLTELQDAQGRITTLSYEVGSPTRLAAVTGPFGHQLQFAYSTAFLGVQTRTRLDYILDPAGNKIDFVFDESGYSVAGNVLTSVVYQDNTKVAYLYAGDFNLAPFQLVGIIDENGDRYASFEYDEHERVMSTQHAGGYGYLELTYDEETATTTVTDSAHNQTIYSFQNESLAVRNPDVIRLPDGSTTTQINEIDGQRRVKYVTDERGVGTLYLYDDFHLTAKRDVFDPNEETWLRETTFSYLNDTSDLQTEIRSESVTNCPGARRQTSVHYIAGTQLVSSFTESGYHPADCSLLERVTTFSDYNASGQPRKIDGPREPDTNGVDDVATIQYYGCTHGGRCGQLKKIINALGHETSFLQYNAHGRLRTKLDPNGLTTDYRYDLRGRVDTITELADGVFRLTDFDYDAAGQIDKITMPDGLILDYTWNEAHLLESITDNLGNSQSYQYDSRGNRIGEELRDPNGLITKAITRAFNARNFVASIREAIYSPSTHIYDAVGNIAQSIDANGNQTVYEFDELNRLIRIIDSLNGTSGSTDFQFSARDNVTAVKAPNGALTTYQYDDHGNVLRETSPDRGTTLYAYDAAGNRTCRAGANENAVSYSRCEEVPERWIYTYDALNRLDTVDYLRTTGLDVDHDYDQGENQLGRLSQVFHESAAGAMVEDQYIYDLFGNLTERRQVIPDARNIGQPYTTHFLYDSNDRIKKITYPSGRIVNYSRNQLGQIVEVSTTSPDYYESPVTTTIVSNVTYYPFGPAKIIYYGNGITQSRLRDNAYRPSSFRLSIWQRVLETRDYSLDAAGNVTRIVDAQNTSDYDGYAYDPLSRLIWDESADTNPATPTYTYDGNGNRLMRAVDMDEGSQTIEYSVGSNRIKSINGVHVSVDPAGNVTDSGTGMSATYNAANRLRSIRKSGTTLSVLYNGTGELVKTVAKGSCSCGVCPKVHEYFSFLPDGRALSVIQDASYAVSTDWIWLDGLPIAQIQESFLADGTHDPSSTEITYLISDHLGTPRIGTDDNGHEVWRMRSDAFGRPSITSSGPVVRLRFPGQVDYGYAGVYYNYYRDYDSDTGRYLESDPIGLQGGTNPYSYAANRPINRVDPHGLIEWTGFSTGLSFSFVFGATFYVYELTSECVNGRQAEATVYAVGPTIGAGISAVSAALGKVTLNDNRSQIDPSVLNGRFSLRSVAISGAGIGGSAYLLFIGGSQTSFNPDGAYGSDVDLFFGVDIGVNLTQGSSTVGDVKWRDCQNNECNP